MGDLDSKWKQVTFGDQLSCVDKIAHKNACILEFILILFWNSFKPSPNDCSISIQHIMTLLGAICHMHLGALLWHALTCWVLLAQTWAISNLSQQNPTCYNTWQQGDKMLSTLHAQQCCNMLCWNVAIVWLGLKGHAGLFYFILRIKLHMNHFIIIMVSAFLFFDEEKTYFVAIQWKDIKQYFPVVSIWTRVRINILLVRRNKYYWKECAL